MEGFLLGCDMISLIVLKDQNQTEVWKMRCRGASVEAGPLSEALAMTQAGAEGAMKESSSHGGSRLWMDREFAEELNVGVEGEGGSEDNS